MAKADDMIMWRCRGCGELHDEEARRDASPRCDGCGLRKERFDEPPPSTEMHASPTRKRNRRRRAVEVEAPAPAPQPDSFSRAMLSTVTDLKMRVGRIEEREREVGTFLAQMVRSVSHLSIVQLQLAFDTTERVGQELMETAAHFKREIDKRKSAS